MTDTHLPQHPDEQSLAHQLHRLADAAFDDSVPINVASVVGTAADKSPNPTSVWSARVFVAAALVLVVASVSIIVMQRTASDRAEVQVATQPAVSPEPAVGESSEPGLIPEVVVEPEPFPMPVDVDVVGLQLSGNETVLVSSGFAWLFTEQFVALTNDRGLTWRTHPTPMSRTLSGCRNNNADYLAGTTREDDRSQSLVLQRANGRFDPGVSTVRALKTPRGTAWGEFCRPAFVGGRWVVGASDGDHLLLVSTDDGGETLSRHVLTLPADAISRGSNGFVDLYANDEALIAEICMEAESVCLSTSVSVPVSLLDAAGEPFAHQVSAGERITEIADLYGVRLRDVLAVNPGLVNPNNLVDGQEVAIPTIGSMPADDPRIRIGEASVQSHPALHEGKGRTWQVVAIDVDEDPEIAYSGAGVYAAGPYGEAPAPFPEPNARRVDVFPRSEGALARVSTTIPIAEGPLPAWYAWSEDDRTWVSISALPVSDWPTLEEWDAPVTYVELAPSGRIRVIPQLVDD